MLDFLNRSEVPVYDFESEIDKKSKSVEVLGELEKVENYFYQPGVSVKNYPSERWTQRYQVETQDLGLMKALQDLLPRKSLNKLTPLAAINVINSILGKYGSLLLSVKPETEVMLPSGKAVKLDDFEENTHGLCLSSGLAANDYWSKNASQLILISEKLFAKPELALIIMAHEIGHAVEAIRQVSKPPEERIRGEVLSSLYAIMMGQLLLSKYGVNEDAVFMTAYNAALYNRVLNNPRLN